MVASRTRRAVVTALLIPTLSVMPACSIFVSANQELTVVPSDEQAEVFVNGKPVGTGTSKVKVKRGKDYSVMAKLGDRAATEKVGRKISGTGVADLVGGFLFLFPFIGVFAPGFWELNPNQISIALPAGAPGYSGSSNYSGIYSAPPVAPRVTTPAPPPSNTSGTGRLPARRPESR